ncbi:PAS domain-containing sensor histidine kinase [Lutibacter citreus]|uniref:PAS domain-containing sensor histidine kinase n=1 Tax=Lutibacter citreus TaxID=2138210 RepID=UPI000DBE19B5|nr:PAS domain-containing sensor histidine kinase [Lutibacter citreus]
MPLKEETAFYKVCFNSMLVGILVCNKKKEIILSNNPLSQIFGYPSNDLHYKNADLLFDNKNLLNEFIQNPSDNKYKTVIECFGLKKDGGKIPLELSFGRIEYVGENYYKALITDISERKAKEEKITTKNFQLEKEVELRNIELENVIKKLKNSLNKEIELNNLKTSFISLASHEFKTPLSAILTSAELIVKYAHLAKTEKINEHLYKVKKLINYLNEMVDSILTLENIECGKIIPLYIKINLDEFISRIIKSSKPLLLKNQKIIFTSNCEEYIYQDAKILEIIISNILFNAIKYSKENGIIKISCSFNKSYLILQIEDDGIGIPKKDHDFIFKRFFRAKNASYFPGTGIGLNIVKGYVDYFKGIISFKSEENKGAIFNVQLPKIKNYE